MGRGRAFVLVLLLSGPARAQCPPVPEPTWCERTTAGADGLLGTPDDHPECANGSPGCGARSGLRWEFADGVACTECVRVFYVPVTTGREVSLWVNLRSSRRTDLTPQLRVRASSVATGLPLDLRAENECSRRAHLPPPTWNIPDAFGYCNDCATTGRLLAFDYAIGLGPDEMKDFESCRVMQVSPWTLRRTLDVVPCLSWRPSGTEIVLGTPADPDGDGDLDEDDDGLLDGVSPPCLGCAACPCGTAHADNPAFTDQSFRIRIPVPLDEPRIVRVEIVGGGERWSLMAGCEPPMEIPAFGWGGAMPLFDNCADAEAWRIGAPALPLLSFPAPPAPGVRIVDDTGCPDIVRIAITACNDGSAPADPVQVTLGDFLSPLGPREMFDLSNHPTDPGCRGPLPPGECRTCEYDLDVSWWSRWTARMDEDFVVREADEGSPVLGCAAGPDEVRIETCVGPCTPHVGGTITPNPACEGDPIVVDASSSGFTGCGAAPEYLLESPLGTPVAPFGWQASPTWTLALMPGTHEYWVRFRCSVAPACEGLTGPLVAEVEPAPAFPSIVRASPEGDCALRVTWDAFGVPGATHDLYRAEAPPVPLDDAHRVAAGLTAATFLDSVPWGRSFTYRVEAIVGCHRVANDGGDSAPVAAVDATPPSFAGIVDTRDLGYCEVEVTWDPAADGCSGVASYDVYRDHGVAHAGETLVASGVASSPYVDTTPGNGTWVYVVRAVDAAGNRDANTVFQQESEGSCENDFPGDAGMDRGRGPDVPRGDGGFRIRRAALGDGLRIRWHPSPDEGGPYPVTYDVVRGNLRNLWEGYDHAPLPGACGLTEHEIIALGQDDGVDAYYLVVAVSGDNATAGYDSFGARLRAVTGCR